MGLFDFLRGDEGGFMDIIRCDETDYLVHKWSPGNTADSTNKENAIRYGSRLRVKPEETAVFLYNHDDGQMADVIKGPVDETIKTANFPVLSDLVGSLYGGESPFMAEIYFFNLQENMQFKFGIPYFDIFDNRFPDLGVPCAVRGTFTINITDIQNFIKLYRLINFEIEDFENAVKDFFTRKIKSIVTNIPSETGLPIVQIERHIDEISNYSEAKLRPEMQGDFGINLKRLDIAHIEIDKRSPYYLQLKNATIDQQTRFIDTKTGVEIINLEEYARIQRKDAEMGIEGKNFNVHKINLQSDILRTAADNLGEMSNVNFGEGGGLNPLGIMTGMAVGGAMGNTMGNMMNGMGNTPPPPPETQYHIALNGQQSGPFTLLQLKEHASQGHFTKNHYVWKQGMDNWQLAIDLNDVAEIFNQVPPPPPPATPNNDSEIKP